MNNEFWAFVDKYNINTDTMVETKEDGVSTYSWGGNKPLSISVGPAGKFLTFIHPIDGAQTTLEVKQLDVIVNRVREASNAPSN